jgi:hypothetical protein
MTVQYMKMLDKIVKIVLEYDSPDSPFAKGERKALMELFKRSAVVQHSVFKVRIVAPRMACVLRLVCLLTASSAAGQRVDARPAKGALRRNHDA